MDKYRILAAEAGMSGANTKHLAEARSPPFATRDEGVRGVKALIAERLAKLSLEAINRVAAQLYETPIGDVFTQTPGHGPARHRDSPKNPGELRGAGLAGLVDREGAEASLGGITVDDDSSDWAESDLLGAVAMADRLNVARATLDNWRRAGKAVAFRRGVRNYVYPSRQFVRHGPVEGLRDVAASFASPEEAWEWLVTPNGYTNGQPPIDRLKDGHGEEVMRAAEGALDFA